MLGNRQWYASDAPGLVTPNAITVGATEAWAGEPYWDHFTLDADDPWSPALIEFQVAIVRMEIWVPAGDEVWLGFDRAPARDTTDPTRARKGTYDAYAPSGAQLVLAVPSVQRLTLLCTDDDGPTNPVEVYVMNGPYATLGR